MFHCYVCSAPVTELEHQVVETMIDHIDSMYPEVVEKYCDVRGLIHCMGPADNFDSDGGVVVCPKCCAEALGTMIVGEDL